jgi:hypothetical protein
MALRGGKAFPNRGLARFAGALARCSVHNEKMSTGAALLICSPLFKFSLSCIEFSRVVAYADLLSIRFH